MYHVVCCIRMYGSPTGVSHHQYTGNCVISLFYDFFVLGYRYLYSQHCRVLCKYACMGSPCSPCSLRQGTCPLEVQCRTVRTGRSRVCRATSKLIMESGCIVLLCTVRYHVGALHYMVIFMSFVLAVALMVYHIRTPKTD